MRINKSIPVNLFGIYIVPFLFFFFFSLNFSYGQEGVQKLIDSLNYTSSAKRKVDLCKKIALELKFEDWERGFSYIELAEKEASNNLSPEELAAVYVVIAKLYDAKNVIDVSLEYYLKAYNIYKNKNNVAEQISIENNLAIIYARLNNAEKASYYFKNVFKYHHNNFKTRDSIQYATILNNLGTLYLDKGSIDSSLTYYNRALEINSKLDNNMIYAYVYTNLGRANYIKDSASLKAKEYYKKAIAIVNDSITNNEIRSIVYQYAAEYYLKENKNDSSIYFARKAQEEAKENMYSFNVQNAVKTIYTAYINEQKYKEASSYFELYNTIRDSIHLEKQAVNVERLKLQQEYQTKLEIRKIAEEKKQFKYLLIVFILISGLLTLSLLLLKYRNKVAYNKVERKLLEAKKQELEYNLSKKNRALVSKAMIEVQKASTVKQVLKDLKHLKLKVSKKESQESINQVIHKLQRELNLQIWKEFELSFEQVHKSFYKNLNEKHPTLTPKDRRLCSLLFLDLTSKEISQITGQSFKSIENARTRLRKKLQLTNLKVNLSSYLKTFV